MEGWTNEWMHINERMHMNERMHINELLVQYTNRDIRDIQYVCVYIYNICSQMIQIDKERERDRDLKIEIDGLDGSKYEHIDQWMNEQIYRRKHGKQSERQLYGNLGCIGLKATISSGKAKTNHLTKQGETIGTNQQGKKLQKQKPKTSAKHEGTCLVVSLFILFAFVLFSEY
jgi:hypothetical protein